MAKLDQEMLEAGSRRGESRFVMICRHWWRCARAFAHFSAERLISFDRLAGFRGP